MSRATAPVLPGIETPPASLRLRGSAWGIDPSTYRIALGIVQPQPEDVAPEIGWFTHAVAQHDKGPKRLAALHEALVGWFGGLARAAPPLYVLVEQPFGQGKSRPHPQSYYVVSAVLVALVDALGDAAFIDLVEPSSWKSEAMGQGAGFARKPAILAWARSHGYPGDCPSCHAEADDCDHACKAHDEADALGIATSAGVRLQAGRIIR